MPTSPKRGRPFGDGCDDTAILNAVADMLIANPRLRPTTAIRRIRQKATETELHRYLRKWRDRKETLLAQAQERAAKRAAAPPAFTGGNLARRTRDMHVSIGRALEVVNGSLASRYLNDRSAVSIAMERAESASARIARELAGGTVGRIVRDLEESNTTRLARQYADIVGKLQRDGFL